MANKGSILNGLLEKAVLKALSRLSYAATGELRVALPGTQAVSGTVNATVNTAGTVAVAGSTVAAGSTLMTQVGMQQSFRRNLVVT